jgi:hypothetical protein
MVVEAQRETAGSATGVSSGLLKQQRSKAMVFDSFYKARRKYERALARVIVADLEAGGNIGRFCFPGSEELVDLRCTVFWLLAQAPVSHARRLNALRLARAHFVRTGIADK